MLTKCTRYDRYSIFSGRSMTSISISFDK